MRKKVVELEKKLNIKFNDIDILRTAFVHRSYLNEHPKFELDQNERLEFLGDAVIELIVTEYLYLEFGEPEGELTNWRAALVNAKMLAEVASDLSLEDFLFLSKGEAKDTNPKARNYILANVFEALVGAIYIDQGWPVSKNFIHKYLLIKLPEILEKKLYLDPKSRFQESSQEQVGVTPTYRVLEESGPDHDKKFRIGVYLEEKKVAEGEGTSKQEAQVAAAENAIEKKGW